MRRDKTSRRAPEARDCNDCVTTTVYPFPLVYNRVIIRYMENETNFLNKIAGNIVVAMLVVGVPAFILSVLYRMVMCWGGNGSNTTYCM